MKHDISWQAIELEDNLSNSPGAGHYKKLKMKPCYQKNILSKGITVLLASYSFVYICANVNNTCICSCQHSKDGYCCREVWGGHLQLNLGSTLMRVGKPCGHKHITHNSLC